MPSVILKWVHFSWCQTDIQACFMWFDLFGGSAILKTATQKLTQYLTLIRSCLYLLQRQEVNSLVHYFHVLIGVNSGWRRNRKKQVWNSVLLTSIINQNMPSMFSPCHSSSLSLWDWTYWTQRWPLCKAASNFVLQVIVTMATLDQFIFQPSIVWWECSQLV